VTVGAVEAGGTKFVCALAQVDAEDPSQPPKLVAEESIATGAPGPTLEKVRRFFEAAGAAAGGIEAFGIGCFGPIDPLPGSPTWGRILATPKKGWIGTDVAGFFQGSFGKPVAFDTDVNAAALGESLWGAARGVENFIYLTVGTGIGGGAFVEGRLLHGAGHPEMGHIRLSRDPTDAFEGSCPFHGSCLEGLASGPAIEMRWGRKGTELGPEHPAWELEASYLAQGVASLCLALSPELFILGGGVGGRPDLLQRTRELLPAALGGYRRDVNTKAEASRLLVAPGLGTRSGILGAAGLAARSAGAAFP
jgi:fructokinase